MASSDGEGAVGLAMLINCAEPARENVMNAHGRNPFISCCG
jgi:hypothetical protein